MVYTIAAVVYSQDFLDVLAREALKAIKSWEKRKTVSVEKNAYNLKKFL